jgi:hypothetical protein
VIISQLFESQAENGPLVDAQTSGNKISRSGKNAQVCAPLVVE